MSVTVYVEGGGSGEGALRTEARQAFSRLIERAGLAGRMPRIVACGSRSDAYQRFRTAVQQFGKGQGNFPILLVDSEEAVNAAAWEHLETRDGWKRPPTASADQAQPMVQCMEAWFLADREALGEYFGKGFDESALPLNRNLEQIDRRSLYDALDRAVKDTPKRRYSKGAHSFAILARLDPRKVRNASPHAEKFSWHWRRPVLEGEGPGVSHDSM